MTIITSPTGEKKKKEKKPKEKKRKENKRKEKKRKENKVYPPVLVNSLLPRFDKARQEPRSIGLSRPMFSPSLETTQPRSKTSPIRLIVREKYPKKYAFLPVRVKHLTV